MPRGAANGVTAVVQGGQGAAAPIVLVSVEDGGTEDGATRFSPRRAPAAAADDAAATAAARVRVLRRAGASACAALSLGVLGSTVFPIPFAVSRTGLLSAALTMLLVAAANDATSGWLIDAAAATGHSSYESLALWAGGRRLRVATQLSLIALLWGTMVAGLCLIADTGRMALSHVFAPAAAAAAGDASPATPVGGGRLVMLGVSAFVLFPLCLQRRMRELEAAGAAGGVLVLGLVALLCWRGARAGWAGFADVPVWSLAAGDPALLPEAFAIFATAFYMQPMLLPLVRDMPGVEAGGGGGQGGDATDGGGNEDEEQASGSSATAENGLSSPLIRRAHDAAADDDDAAPSVDVTAAQGLAALRAAVRVTLYVVAIGVYLGVGVFGAGAFGAETHGNVLTNDVLDEGWGDGPSSDGGGGGSNGGFGKRGGGGSGGGAAPKAAVARPKRAAAATLYALVLLYLALGMTTTLFALRASLDIAIFGAAGADVGADAPVCPLLGDEDDDEEDGDEDGDEDEDDEEEDEEQEAEQGGRRRPKSPPRRRRRQEDEGEPSPPLRPGFTWPRHILLTAGSISSAAFVACLVPRAAERVYAVVGATGVCAVSYVIPALLKVQLYREKKGLVHRAGAVGAGAHEAAAAATTEAAAAAAAAATTLRAPRVVVAASSARQPRPPAGGSALSLPLLDPWGEQGPNGGQGARAAYIFAAHAPSSASASAGAGVGSGGGGAGLLLDDELAGLVAPSALLTPPPPPPPPPRVAVRREPAAAAAARTPGSTAAAAAAAAPRHRAAPPRRWRLLPPLEDAPAGPARRALVREMAREVGLPVAVAVFGVTSSAAALAVAIRQAFFPSSHGDNGGASVVAAALGRFVETNILA